ncbi:HAD-IA family hydrolase, partial [Halobellus sp. Atlit-38R]|uniref:HAD-IA family hydrolase n=1 Tax=Halobellus sp. Atlit-38R TaxID=2282131 RepID=UPI001F1A20AA
IAVETHGLADAIDGDAIVGRDTVGSHKPDPASLLAAIDRLGAAPEDALFVGDSRRDAVAAERGGVDFAVRKAIRLGVDPVEAVQMATVNTAESYGLPFGRIRPGAPADLVLLSDLRTWEVDHVVVDGAVDPTKGGGAPPASAIATDTVRFEP